MRAEKNLIPRWIVVLEGSGDVEPFRALAERFAADAAFTAAVAPPVVGVYRLQASRATLPWSAA